MSLPGTLLCSLNLGRTPVIHLVTRSFSLFLRTVEQNGLNRAHEKYETQGFDTLFSQADYFSFFQEQRSPADLSNQYPKAAFYLLSACSTVPPATSAAISSP